MMLKKELRMGLLRYDVCGGDDVYRDDVYRDDVYGDDGDRGVLILRRVHHDGDDQNGDDDVRESTIGF